MSLSKLTSKYQVTLPSDIRNFLHLSAGDKVEFALENGRVVVKKPNPIDWEYVNSLEYGLSEWLSEEDNNAYNTL